MLKLWLAEKNGQGASSVEVERMMVEFPELQAGIREKMSAVVFLESVRADPGALWIVQSNSVLVVVGVVHFRLSPTSIKRLRMVYQGPNHLPQLRMA